VGITERRDSISSSCCSTLACMTLRRLCRNWIRDRAASRSQCHGSFAEEGRTDAGRDYRAGPRVAYYFAVEHSLYGSHGREPVPCRTHKPIRPPPAHRPEFRARVPSCGQGCRSLGCRKFEKAATASACTMLGFFI
jgi:hypothetical protein